MRDKTRSNDFETAYESFLLSDAYEDAQELLQQCIREAFRAGWNAAHESQTTHEPKIIRFAQ